jgi:holo-[acyl-carrier protein] synthase
MKQSLGLDIVEVDRMRRMRRRFGKKALEKLFTPGELRYCLGQKNCFPHLAARLAAKEAVLKAFGDGWQGKWRWKDMAVERRPTGQPEMALSGAAAKLAKRLGVRRISLTLSHSRKYAVAAVLLERAK